MQRFRSASKPRSYLFPTSSLERSNSPLRCAQPEPGSNSCAQGRLHPRCPRSSLPILETRYNYQTRSDDDPKNLLLLCTTQGSAIQQDGAGAKKLYHHAVNPSDKTGEVCRYWFEAERTKHKVGGAQKETDEEKADALKRGKAVSAVIGTRAMGALLGFYKSTTPPANSSGLPSSTCSRISSANRGLRARACLTSDIRLPFPPQVRASTC